MTDKINEQLSAFIDGELPDAERELLQRRLVSDDELQASWQRYHLIRDAMREDLPEYINLSNTLDYAESEYSDETQTATTAGRRFLRPLAGMAIAASVAMLAVVGVLYDRGESEFGASSQLASSASQAEFNRSDSFNVIPKSGWQSAKPTVVSHLNGYLVDHSRYAGFGSAQGIIPYSRVAGYDRPMPDRQLEKEQLTKETNTENRQ